MAQPTTTTDGEPPPIPNEKPAVPFARTQSNAQQKRRETAVANHTIDSPKVVVFVPNSNRN
jgi:hypothetical protein